MSIPVDLRPHLGPQLPDVCSSDCLLPPHLCPATHTSRLGFQGQARGIQKRWKGRCAGQR